MYQPAKLNSKAKHRNSLTQICFHACIWIQCPAVCWTVYLHALSYISLVSRECRDYLNWWQDYNLITFYVFTILYSPFSYLSQIYFESSVSLLHLLSWNDLRLLFKFFWMLFHWCWEKLSDIFGCLFLFLQKKRLSVTDLFYQVSSQFDSDNYTLFLWFFYDLLVLSNVGHLQSFYPCNFN